MLEPLAEVRIRSFRDEDLGVLREMTVEAFEGVSIDQNIERQFGLIQGRGWGFRKGRHVDEDVRRSPEGIFVAESPEGTPLGFISTWCDRETGVGHIPNLVVAAGMRGKGVGRRLIAFAADRFRDAGVSHVRIETLDQNPIGNHLYRQLGFREVARQVHFCASLEDLPTQSPPPSTPKGDR